MSEMKMVLNRSARSGPSLMGLSDVLSPAAC